jgi:hypothetical protein
MTFVKLLFWIVVVAMTAKSMDIISGRKPGNISIKNKSLKIGVLILLGILLVVSFWKLMQEGKALAGI